MLKQRGMQKKKLRPKIFSQKYRKIQTSLSSYCAYCYPLQLANFDAERKSLADFLANFRVFISVQSLVVVTSTTVPMLSKQEYSACLPIIAAVSVLTVMIPPSMR